MFELKTAVQLAKLCAATYTGDMQEIHQWRDARTIEIKALSDQLVIIVKAERCNIVAFRGTATLGGWLRDVEIGLTRDPVYPGKVHYGFMIALEGVLDWILDVLQKDMPVEITGHSLGGALATLLAVKLRNRGYSINALYTFGSPRVGDVTFARQFVTQHYRVVNDMDPIPYVPTGAGYTHTGEEVRLPEFDVPGKWRNLTRLLSSLRRGLGAIAVEAIKDHFIESYQSALSVKGRVDLLPR